MAVVDAQRINDFLSNPQWNPAQWQECATLCEQKEALLADRLNTKITPEPWTEEAPLLSTGLVGTTYPVYQVTRLNGADIPTGDPLPDGWLVQNHRLRRPPSTTFGLTGGFTLGGLSGLPARVENVGVVSLSYLAGFGAVPSLVASIVERVAAVMVNRHDDSVTVTEDGQARARAPLSEEWTDDDIAALGIYRNLVVFR